MLDRHEYKNAIMTIVAKPDEQSVYDLLRRDYPRTIIATSQTGKVTRPTIVHDTAQVSDIGFPSQIVTSYKTSRDHVILRLYKP